MSFLRNISIYRKLIFIQMITALCVVVLVSGSFVFVHFQEFKKDKVDNINSIMDLLSTNSASAIIFGDVSTAQDILSDLKGRKDIVSVEIKNSNGKTFAYYTREAKFKPLSYINQNKAVSHQFSKDFLYATHKIFHQNEYIGTILVKCEIKDLDLYLQKRINIALGVVLIGIIIAYMLSTLLQKYISKPIYELLSLMEIVKSNSNYSLRSKQNGRDEVGKLSMVFNAMLNEIEKKDLILSEHNQTLREKVTERTQELEENNLKLQQANEDLVKAKIYAEQSKAAKESFLANISHEIRTPLNSIVGFQQLLKNTDLDDQQLEYVLAIDFAGRNLLSLINDLLDLSKIESGKLVFENKDFSINETIQAVVELLKQRAIDKNLALNISVDEKLHKTISGDSTRFSQILINLIGNAIKFTDQGEVAVDASVIAENEQELECLFVVRDTGIGIDEKHLTSIFERFSQAEEETTRLYGGTGLGLTICKYLVEGFGGTIDVESELGKGSVFGFKLRFNKLKLAAENRTAVESKEVKANPKLKILVAEDVDLNQKLMSKVMNSWGFEYQIAENGEIAVRKMEEMDFDLVLMDIQMPKMNGFEATKAIRNMKNPVKKGIPIIALTAQASNAESQKCLDAGMNEYATKPFDQQVLLKTILRLTEENQQKAAKQTEDDPENQTREQGFFNLSHLKEKAAGDHDFLKEMFDTYIETIPQYLEELSNHLSDLNSDLILTVIHKLKGPLALFGVKRLTVEIQDLEVQHQQKEVTEIWFQRVAFLLEECNRSIDLLKLEMAKNPL